MMAFPHEWQSVPMIKISHPQLKEFLGTDSKLIAFNQLLDLNNPENYRIKSFVDEAYGKKPKFRNKFDKEIIAVDERVNIAYMVYTESLMKLFPIPNDKSGKWITPGTVNRKLSEDEGLFVKGIFSMYTDEVRKGVHDNTYTTANEYLKYISLYQLQHGKELIPSERKINMEILYNKLNIF